MKIDPIRLVHVKVMLRSFVHHPLFGTGLGSFYENYFENLNWAISTGGAKYADPPASLYLMIASELGTAGLIFLAVSLGLLAKSVFSLIHKSTTTTTTTSREGIWHCAGVGLLISLGLSFLIGSPLLFLSVTTLLALGIFAIGLPTSEAGNWLEKRWLANTLFLCAGILSISCLVLLSSAPRAPAFRWHERGVAQVPLSLSVPIHTRGLRGTWIASGGEVLYQGSPIRIFIEMPQEFYPLTIKARFIGQNAEELITKTFHVDSYDKAQPWRVFVLAIDDPSICAIAVGPMHFCSIQIETEPVWRWSGQDIGFFLAD